MEETVVLKLQTYNDLKQQIANLEKVAETAIKSVNEAHDELCRMKNAYKPMIKEYISRNTYGNDFREFYESEKERLVNQGIFYEFDQIRSEMADAKRAEIEEWKEARKAKEKEELLQSPSDLMLAQDDPFATMKVE